MTRSPDQLIWAVLIELPANSTVLQNIRVVSESNARATGFIWVDSGKGHHLPFYELQ